MVFRTVLSHRGQLADCRNLSIVAEFYDFSYQQVKNLIGDISDSVNSLQNGLFVTSWTVDGRKKLKFSSHNIELLSEEKGRTVYFDSLLKSEEVYNQSTLKKAMKELELSYHTTGLYPYVSADYPLYLSESIQDKGEFSDVLQNLIQGIFTEPNKKHLNVGFRADMAGFFSATPCENIPNLFYGYFHIDISAVCVENCIQECAKLFLDTLTQLSQKYRNMNGRVMLQPIAPIQGKSPYMRYFGEIDFCDGSHEQMQYAEQEWYPGYYLCGVEWANLIGPRAQVHFKNTGIPTSTNGIHSEQISGGGILVRSDRNIDEYDVSDAIKLKKLLYPCLYRGGSRRSLKHLFDQQPTRYIKCSNLPRSDWAIVPVLEREIRIVGRELFIVPIQNGLDELE